MPPSPSSLLAPPAPIPRPDLLCVSATSSRGTMKRIRVHNASLPPAAARAAEHWHAVVKGRQLRRSIHVTTLAPGMVAVHLQASPALLQRMGLQHATTAALAEDPPDAVTKRLAWMSLDPRRFSGHVVQGDALLDPCVGPAGEAAARPCARINGGYFNFRQRACVDRPEHLSIGPLRTQGGTPQPTLPLPPAFADDYHELGFADGSSLACAPLLAERGAPVFAAKASGSPLYQLPRDFAFERGDQVAPGVLWHAHDANPRAAVSLPTTADSGCIRLVAAPMTDRGCADSGWTLAEFSGALARLDRLGGQHGPPNISLNLDGGESVALLAWTEGRPVLDIRQTAQPRQVGNLIEFRAAACLRSPEMVRCVKLGG